MLVAAGLLATMTDPYHVPGEEAHLAYAGSLSAGGVQQREHAGRPTIGARRPQQTESGER
jgi:hypothetical protein